MAAIGFDIGAETCYVCMSKGVGFEVVDNELSHRCNANVLFFNDQRRFFGHTADTSMFSNLNGSIKYVKNLIGLYFDDPFAQSEMAKSHCRFVKLESGEIGVKVLYLRQETIFSVVQVYAMVLSHLKAVAQRHTEKRVAECVIAVPSFFSDHQRQRLIEASKVAGLKCIRLLNDGSAASLNAAVFRADWTEPKKVAIVDVGSFNVTVTISEIKPFHAKVLSSATSMICSGSAIDRTMCQIMLEKFQQKNPSISEIPNKARLKLLKQCMLTKKKVSMAPKATQTLQIECFIGDTIDLNEKITYADIESMLSYFEEDMAATVSRALERAKLSIDAIEKVDLIGGSSRFPIYSTILSKMFNKPVGTSMNADETVVKGCGIMSGLLSPFVKMKHVEFEEAMQNSVIVRWAPMKDEKTSENNIFYAGLPIPSTRALMLHRHSDFDIEVSYLSDIHQHTESYRISGFPSGSSKIDYKVVIKFRMDANEALSVLEAVAEAPVKKGASKTRDGPESPSSNGGENDEKKTEEGEKTLSENSGDALQTGASPKSSNIVLKVTLVSGIRSGDSLEELTKLFDTEKQMLNQIIEVEKKNESLNALEELLYSCETDISGELKPYISEATVQKVTTLSADHWNWIETVKYDKSFTFDDCNSRHQALLELLSSARSRLNFFQIASSAVPQAEELFLKTRSFIDEYSMGSELYIHIEPSKIDLLESKLDECAGIINGVKDILSSSSEKLADVEVPNVTDIATKLAHLSNLFSQAISTPKPQPIVIEEQPPTSDDSSPATADTKQDDGTSSATEGSSQSTEQEKATSS